VLLQSATVLTLIECKEPGRVQAIDGGAAVDTSKVPVEAPCAEIDGMVATVPEKSTDELNVIMETERRIACSLTCLFTWSIDDSM